MSDTLAVYNARAQDYAERTKNLQEWPDFDALCARLPAPAHVLDLGCGPGHYAARFVQAGHSVEAVDGSAEMVALAAKRPGVNARQALFHQIDGVALYDAIWANFSLLHAPRADFPGHLSRLHRALKPGGWLHLGMKLGIGEGPDSIGRFYSYYTEAQLDEHLTRAGFAPVSRRLSEGPGMDGTPSRFICLLAQGIPNDTPKG
ncbi:trans-aconitate 2-methyltransferase [Vannielia sp.]|uniref:class I SAM-dependent methyltransferase n=1 Tax=Vannielia sp. TaxID=2813045 RepID=UPI002613ECA0|nr:class I SAM-dependent methyltransferase [Vannielia sp.]MDF1873269.1 class I SAM-dependent methyltransferase [Vannielia sp.]